MIFIKNGTEYPRFIGDLENENPGWTLGQSIPSGWAIVQETAQPAISSSQTAKEVFPRLVDGAWVQSWEIVDLSASELEGLAAAQVEVLTKLNPGPKQP